MRWFSCRVLHSARWQHLDWLSLINSDFFCTFTKRQRHELGDCKTLRSTQKSVSVIKSKLSVHQQQWISSKGIVHCSVRISNITFLFQQTIFLNSPIHLNLKYEWPSWPPPPFAINFLFLATLNFWDGPLGDGLNVDSFHHRVKRLYCACPFTKCSHNNLWVPRMPFPDFQEGQEAIHCESWHTKTGLMIFFQSYTDLMHII